MLTNTQYTNRFTNLPVEQKMVTELNNAGVDRFVLDVPSTLSPKVVMADRYVILNWKAEGGASNKVGDPDLIKSLLNVVTENALGNIHAELGCSVGNLDRAESYAENFGIVRADYVGKFTPLITGLEKVQSRTGDEAIDKIANQRYFILTKDAGYLRVARELVKIGPKGDKRLQEQREVIANAWLLKQKAIDMLFEGKPVFCYFNDGLANYVHVKWQQFQMDLEALKQDKHDRILNKVGKRAASVAYAEVAQAQNVASQVFAETGIEVPIALTLPTNVVKIIGKKGKTVLHVLSPVEDPKNPESQYPVMVPGVYQRLVGDHRQKQDAVLGEDQQSRFMISRQAVAGIMFRPA